MEAEFQTFINWAVLGVGRGENRLQSAPSDRDLTTETNVRHIFVFWPSAFHEINPRFLI
jgi:hypothetical protein